MLTNVIEPDILVANPTFVLFVSFVVTIFPLARDVPATLQFVDQLLNDEELHSVPTIEPDIVVANPTFVFFVFFVFFVVAIFPLAF